MLKPLFRVAAGLAVGVCAVAGAQRNNIGTHECEGEARRALGTAARVIRLGDFLHIGQYECLAVVPYGSVKTGSPIRVRKGFISQRSGATWHNLLRFEGNITNPAGYIGVDFIDVKTNFGFSVQTSEKRSDDTPGFTLYLRYLNSHLEPEGTAVEVSWNSRVRRFQEYAANEIGSRDFKAEVPNPPIIEILKGAPRHSAPQIPK